MKQPRRRNTHRTPHDGSLWVSASVVQMGAVVDGAW